MNAIQQEALTQHDLTSITALVEYLAFEKGFQRENAYYLLETEFNVPDVSHIKRGDFDRAIAFLVDLENITIH
jgi:hypothetical protein